MVFEGSLVVGSICILLALLLLFLRAPVVTGTIASGKSKVVSILKELMPELVVIDADQIAREILEPGQPAYNEVVRRFGPSILDGHLIDRKKLAQVVFADPQKRRILNRATHGRVFWQIFTRLLSAKGARKKVVCDVPLLFESPWYFRVWFSPKILGVCDERTKIDRAMRRDGVDEEAVRRRLHAQIPDQQKKLWADIVVDNNGTVEELKIQVQYKVLPTL